MPLWFIQSLDGTNNEKTNGEKMYRKKCKINAQTLRMHTHTHNQIGNNMKKDREKNEKTLTFA